MGYQQNLAVDRTLDFGQKLHNVYYNHGCKNLFHGYDVNTEGYHAFVTILTLKVKWLNWIGDYCEILDIPTDKYTVTGV